MKLWRLRRDSLRTHQATFSPLCNFYKRSKMNKDLCERRLPACSQRNNLLKQAGAEKWKHLAEEKANLLNIIEINRDNMCVWGGGQIIAGVFFDCLHNPRNPVYLGFHLKCKYFGPCCPLLLFVALVSETARPVSPLLSQNIGFLSARIFASKNRWKLLAFQKVSNCCFFCSVLPNFLLWFTSDLFCNCRAPSCLLTIWFMNQFMPRNINSHNVENLEINKFWFAKKEYQFGRFFPFSHNALWVRQWK